MKYIFFGSNEFSQMVLEGLIKNGLKPVLVVAPERKPQGRKKVLLPSPVESLALKENIPVLTPNVLDDDFILKIKEIGAEFALLSAYGKIIPSYLLKIFPKGFLNLHPSLLPKLRGATPIQTAILNGEKETGVTLFIMDEKIDHGPIISQLKIPIDPSYNYLDLLKILAEEGVNLILKTIPLWLEGKISPIPQDDRQASYCHKITKEDEKINWQNDTFFIDRQIKAFNPKPGTYTSLNNKIYKIIKGRALKDNHLSLTKRVGEIFEFNNEMAVKAKNGFYVIELIKPEGKTEMKASDFLKGNKKLIGQIFN